MAFSQQVVACSCGTGTLQGLPPGNFCRSRVAGAKSPLSCHHVTGPTQRPAHAEFSGCTREIEERIETRRISRSLAALRVSSCSNLSGSVAGILPPAPAQTLGSCVMQLVTLIASSRHVVDESGTLHGSTHAAHMPWEHA